MSNAGIDDRVNVLQLVNAYGGGPGVVVYNLAKYLDARRYRTAVCRLVTWNRPQEEAVHQSLLDLGVESINLNINERVLHGAFDVRVFVELRNLLRERRIDILHTHLIRADFFGRLASWNLDVSALVTTVHNVERYHVSSRPIPRLARWFERRSSRRAGKVVCVAEAVRQAIMEREGLDAEKMLTIVNGIDLEHYRRNGTERRVTKADLGIDPDRPVIGTVGRFYPQKGLPYLIQAGLGVVRRRSDVVFLMVGEGPTRHQMWSEIEVLGLAENFVLAGPRIDIREILSAMDIFVMPSLWEGLPLAVLEAMAMELPCIVTNVGGNAEVVENGRTGWIIRPRDPGELEERILALLEDEEGRRRMGSQARRVVEKRFDARHMAQGYERLYAELLEQKVGGKA